MRNRYLLLLDLLLLTPLPFLWVALRMESLHWSPELLQSVCIYASFAIAIRVGAFYFSGVYRCMWRYAGPDEVERLLFAGIVAGACSFLVGFALPALSITPMRLPLGALVGDPLSALALVAAPRLLFRLYSRHSRALPLFGRRRALIVGAGALGNAIEREARTNADLRLQLVGFVDDDPAKLGHLLGGVPIVGAIADIAAQAQRLGVQDLLIAIRSAKGPVLRRILDQATKAGLTARMVPGISDIVTGRVQVQQLRKVEISDLLHRESIVTDLAAVGALLRDQVVLVTGAGGSIGSELVRQIAGFGPRAIIALDHSENQVFDIEQEMARHTPRPHLEPVIADIRDANRLRCIFQRFKPSIVFHAAAHKHVPLMEAEIVEAVTNNILGTRNVVEAALDEGTEHFVLISTDKAVRPTSVMGATKRVAEQIVQQAAASDGRSFVSVRFGNVLASRGSVIPTFQRQIEAGGPVTVTHPEMRRYFMTIPEAVQLVLQAGALGSGDELFVLDMGEPVKIVDLARDLIRLSGLEEGSDIRIEYTGTRPGEKLYEDVLFGDEQVFSTHHPKVLRTTAPQPADAFADHVETLIRMVTLRPTDHAAARDLLRMIVPDFLPTDRRERNERNERRDGPGRARQGEKLLGS
jgi:FlaA1/EpsC-like NDP-sugar epimerase